MQDFACKCPSVQLQEHQICSLTWAHVHCSCVCSRFLLADAFYFNYLQDFIFDFLLVLILLIILFASHNASKTIMTNLFLSLGTVCGKKKPSCATVGGENRRWCFWKSIWESLHAESPSSDIKGGGDVYLMGLLPCCSIPQDWKFASACHFFVTASGPVTGTWFRFACMHCWSGLLIVLWGTSLHLSWRLFYFFFLVERNASEALFTHGFVRRTRCLQ